MARRTNRRNTTEDQGNFVPASQSSATQRRSRGAHAAPQSSPSFSFQDSMAQYSRATADYSHRAQSSSNKSRNIAIVLVVLLVVAIGALGFFIFKEYQKDVVNRDLHGGLSSAELQAVDNELTGMTTFEEPFTVLLLGSDARLEDASMGARTDTIVLVRVDPLTNNITMLSIPRDTRVNLPGVGYDKFNAAYAYGGPSGTIAAVKDLLDVEIDHYAEVNFEGLVGLIDAIGGIDVYVEETIDDPNAGDIVIPAGEQHLDGAAALVFSRSRAYADGDYTRVSNQRKVLEAIIHRGLEAPATELYGIIKSCTGFLTTDSGMDMDFIYSLADQIRHNNEYPVTITTATLPSEPKMIGDTSYVIADPAGVTAIVQVFMEGGDIQKAYNEFYGIEDDEAVNDQDVASNANGISNTAGVTNSTSANANSASNSFN